MERTIRVTGKGKIAVAPDMIKLYITQSSIKKTHEDSIKASAECKRELNDKLAKIGFKKEELKTVYFYIDSEYESYHDKNDNYKRRFKGYKFTHSMNLSFPVNSNKLGMVLGVIASCSDNPEFSISYTVSDLETAKNELLASAVKDAKTKAGVLAKASGAKLGEIVNIDYSWGEIEFTSRPIRHFEMMNCLHKDTDGSIDLDIEAEDIIETDTVTVVWSIS